MRPDFEDIFIKFALLISERSYDEKTKVGCVIASTDHMEVYSIGYNGNAHGLPNKRDSMQTGESGFIHAELNAALKCNAPRNAPKNVYISHFPCIQCTKALIQLGGVKTVYFKNFYGNTEALEIFNQVGIQLIHVL